jgi:hypothetical protein
MESLMLKPRAFATLMVAGALALPFWGRSAMADIAIYDLTAGNSGGLDAFTGPFVEVTVNRTSSTTATFDFKSLTNGGYTYLMISNGAAAANINASTFTISGISGTNSFAGFTPGPVSTGGTGNLDGFGSFNAQIDSFDSFTHSENEIKFTVTNTSGTWATVTDVLTPNGTKTKEILAVQAGAWDGTFKDGFKATGFASDAGPPSFPPSSTPEPSTLAIAGLGALGFLGYGLRRRRAI